MAKKKKKEKKEEEKLIDCPHCDLSIAPDALAGHIEAVHIGKEEKGQQKKGGNKESLGVNAEDLVGMHPSQIEAERLNLLLAIFLELKKLNEKSEKD